MSIDGGDGHLASQMRRDWDPGGISYESIMPDSTNYAIIGN